jgi:hypothetical protein
VEDKAGSLVWVGVTGGVPGWLQAVRIIIRNATCNIFEWFICISISSAPIECMARNGIHLADIINAE